MFCFTVHSSITGENEYLFICLAAICISSSQDCMFLSFTHISIRLFFSLLVCRHSLYIFITILPFILVTIILSSRMLVFLSGMCIFGSIENFIFMRLSNFTFQKINPHSRTFFHCFQREREKCERQIWIGCLLESLQGIKPTTWVCSLTGN